MKVYLFSNQNFDLKMADIRDNEIEIILEINNYTNFDKLLFSINIFSQKNYNVIKNSCPNIALAHALE